MDHTLALIGRIHQGDKEARDTLFSENIGLVYSVARRFLGRGVEMEDLFQIGSIGLLKAVDHFNPEFDVKFSTYAVPMIIGEIKRFLRDDGILKVSRSIKENQYKICKMREELEKKLGREPDLRELSDAMDMPMEELAMTLESAAEVDSIYKTVYQGDGTDLQLVDRLPEKEDRHEKLLNRIFLEEILEKLELTPQPVENFKYYSGEGADMLIRRCLKDAGDPVEIAKAYDKAGADELVFLDITASSDARGTVVDMVRKVAENVFIPFTVGGGIRTVDDFKALLREGADKISINSSAINTPNLISEAAEKFGSQCVVVAIDAKKREDGSGWNIYKNGGRIDVGIDAVEWASKVEKLGAGEILLTSMDCDGTKAGYDLELTKAIAGEVNIPVIASGGAGSLEHFYDALTEGKADAALAASLFHYKELEIREVKEYLRGKGVSVRL